MKRIGKLLIPALLIILVVVNVFSVKFIVDIQQYGKLINYLGIVRGATQRLVKLELVKKPDHEMIDHLDQILLELSTGRGEIGLVLLDDKVYTSQVDYLSRLWISVKKNILEQRVTGDTEKLLSISEEHFEAANEMVLAAEEYSNKKVGQLLIFIVIIVAGTLLTWSFMLFSYMRQVFHLKNTNKNLEKIAYNDNLTGASNLEKFGIDAENYIKQNPHLHYAIFYIDFENFKYLNDVFGYSYGDLILKQYVKILTEDMNITETFGRVSGDNFVVLRNFTNREELVQRQKLVDEKMTDFAQKTKEKQNIVIYSGICCLDDIVETLPIDGLINRANFAQKTVKNQAGDHYAFYNENIRNKMLSEKKIESNMHDALKNGEFVVYLQPKVKLPEGKIAGSEALVRWQTPDKGMIFPSDFIPIFEKNLFIVQLDQYVFEKVCGWIYSRMQREENILPVSVNVSRMQFYKPNFVTTYAKIKKKYQIPDGLLEIEFTESMVFEDMARLLQITNDLKEAGFLCSLDDFGKGYSSLNVLKNLPVDVLKLDSLFFEISSNEAKDHAVIKGIIDMAKELHIRIVAEGVESLAQVLFLNEVGCDFVQGYVNYKPMPIDEFVLLLEDADKSLIGS